MARDGGGWGGYDEGELCADVAFPHLDCADGFVNVHGKLKEPDMPIIQCPFPGVNIVL